MVLHWEQNSHKYTKSMVQCHLCQIWAHFKCIDDRKESDIIGIWCCKSCRKLPETTMQLCEIIDQLNRTVNILLKFANSINQSTPNTQSSCNCTRVLSLSDDKSELCYAETTWNSYKQNKQLRIIPSWPILQRTTLRGTILL